MERGQNGRVATTQGASRWFQPTSLGKTVLGALARLVGARPTDLLNSWRAGAAASAATVLDSRLTFKQGGTEVHGIDVQTSAVVGVDIVDPTGRMSATINIGSGITDTAASGAIVTSLPGRVTVYNAGGEVVADMAVGGQDSASSTIQVNQCLNGGKLEFRVTGLPGSAGTKTVYYSLAGATQVSDMDLEVDASGVGSAPSVLDQLLSGPGRRGGA